MTWTTEQLAGLVEPDRAHRKAYTDPEIFDLEMERIFEHTWIYIGHESQVKTRAITIGTGRPPASDYGSRSGRRCECSL